MSSGLFSAWGPRMGSKCLLLFLTKSTKLLDTSCNPTTQASVSQAGQSRKAGFGQVGKPVKSIEKDRNALLSRATSKGSFHIWLMASLKYLSTGRVI